MCVRMMKRLIEQAIKLFILMSPFWWFISGFCFRGQKCKFPRKFFKLDPKLIFKTCRICEENWSILCFRFVVDLIDGFGGRWTTASTESETRLKQSVIDFFASDAQKNPKEMEEFEFELLKAELLTQPIEKEGSQLFHRKASLGTSWIKKVSKTLVN